MAQWGRNDQAVTANGTTTKESSNGAPIGTWALVKGSGNAVSPIAMTPNGHFGNTSSGSRASVDVNMFGNTTPGAFIPGMAAGIFGVDATEMGLQHTSGHAGWVYRKAGTGPVVSVTYSGATAAGYNNADILVVKSQQASGNATIAMTTNSTGGNLTLSITNVGAGFLTTTIPVSNLFITNSTGGTAAGNSTVGNSTVAWFTVNIGGRAGRVHCETLVAMGSLGAQTAAYGTPALVSDAENVIFPNS
jgi:hypothetical protein